MKNRFIKWWFSLYWKYTKTTKKITELEAKRYCEYITDNYSEVEQSFILKELRSNLIEYRENQIKDKEILIIQSKDNIEVLSKNLEKLNNTL